MWTSLGLALVISNATLMVISGFSVVLRLYVRRLKSMSLAADDYLIVVAWILSVGLAVTNIIGVPLGGFGMPYNELTEAQSILFLKLLFAEQFWYIFAVAVIKFSVLSFYGRIFSVRRLPGGQILGPIGGFPLAVRLTMALTAGWLVAFFGATLFQIWPVRCNWTLCPATTNFNLMYALCSASDIVLDTLILSIPLSFIRRLHMSRAQKGALAAVFGLGVFCVVASVARLVYAVRTVLSGNNDLPLQWANSFDGDIVRIIMWSGIEACASVVCANLPCYTVLVDRASLQTFFSRVGAVFSERSSTARRPPTHPKQWGTGTGTHDTTASAEHIIEHGVATVIEGMAPHERGCDVEMGKITVHTSVDVHRGYSRESE